MPRPGRLEQRRRQGGPGSGCGPTRVPAGACFLSSCCPHLARTQRALVSSYKDRNPSLGVSSDAVHLPKAPWCRHGGGAGGQPEHLGDTLIQSGMHCGSAFALLFSFCVFPTRRDSNGFFTGQTPLVLNVLQGCSCRWREGPRWGGPLPTPGGAPALLEWGGLGVAPGGLPVLRDSCHLTRDFIKWPVLYSLSLRGIGGEGRNFINKKLTVGGLNMTFDDGDHDVRATSI